MMRDYPFLPASPPCFDPFPLLQHHPPSLRPAVLHLWINWAQWMDIFYFHQAGHMPKGHFRCLLFPALGSSSPWPVECLLMRCLFTMLFSLKGVGFQKWLPTCLSCLWHFWIEHLCKVIPLGCLFWVQYISYLSHGTIGNMNRGSMFSLVTVDLISPLFTLLVSPLCSSLTLQKTKKSAAHNGSSLCFRNWLTAAS